jgi:hypothetical protein
MHEKVIITLVLAVIFFATAFANRAPSIDPSVPTDGMFVTPTRSIIIAMTPLPPAR